MNFFFNGYPIFLWFQHCSDCGIKWLNDIKCESSSWLEGLTDGGLGGGGHLHTGAIVRYVVVRAGTHWPTGTKQAQPFTLLPITWVSHCKKKKRQIRPQEKTFIFTIRPFKDVLKTHFYTDTHSQAVCSGDGGLCQWHGWCQWSDSLPGLYQTC